MGVSQAIEFFEVASQRGMNVCHGRHFDFLSMARISPSQVKRSGETLRVERSLRACFDIDCWSHFEPTALVAGVALQAFSSDLPDASAFGSRV